MSALDFRIISYNYAFQDNVEISGSSEDPDFPASNAGSYFRSKVWRSYGHFRINSLNDKINFKETGGGPELTASISHGDYSTPSSFGVAVKSALEAATVNARTYTVSYSNTSGKWTIATTTFLSLLFSTGTNASISARNALGMGQNDFTGSITYTGPKTSIHTDERVIFDLESAEQMDSFVLLFDPKVGIKLSEEAVIKIEANPSLNWDSPLFSQTITIDNTSDIATLYLTAPQEYRYWSVKIVDSENPFLYVELGTVFLGLKDTLSRCPDNGFEYKTLDPSKISDNDYGNEYVDEYPLRKSIAFAMNILEYTTKQQLEEMYRRVGIKTPIIVSLDSAERMFDKDEFTIYGRFQKEFSFKHIIKSYFGATFTITETF